MFCGFCDRHTYKHTLIICRSRSWSCLKLFEVSLSLLVSHHTAHLCLTEAFFPTKAVSFFLPFFVNFYNSSSSFWWYLDDKTEQGAGSWLRRWRRRRTTIALSSLENILHWDAQKCNSSLLVHHMKQYSYLAFEVCSILVTLHWCIALKCCLGGMNECSTIAGILQCVAPCSALYWFQRINEQCNKLKCTWHDWNLVVKTFLPVLVQCAHKENMHFQKYRELYESLWVALTV